MQRTIATVNKEINFLEVAYQRLNIKTIEYEAEKEKLLNEKEKLLKLSDLELAKIEREAPVQKESNLLRKLSPPNAGKDKPQSLVIVDPIR